MRAGLNDLGLDPLEPHHSEKEAGTDKGDQRQDVQAEEQADTGLESGYLRFDEPLSTTELIILTEKAEHPLHERAQLGTKGTDTIFKVLSRCERGPPGAGRTTLLGGKPGSDS